MNRLTENKIMLITRPTRLAELVARFNTVAQARFYIEHLGADFADYLQEDENYAHALHEAQTVLRRLGRVQVLDRKFVPNFVFGPEDTIVTLGQDGLVANTLKYLNGQPVVGVNPDPGRWDGELLPFQVGELDEVVAELFSGGRSTRMVTMAKATLNNGQTMYAVNDLFIGPKSHGSARYVIHSGEATERQSSSGVIVSTGLGSTGWFRSLLTGAAAVTECAQGLRANRIPDIWVRKNTAPTRHATATAQPGFECDADYLYFTVREPFPTRTTGASVVFGKVTDEQPLVVLSQMAENGVIFSDGMEKDFLEFNSGTKATITLAEKHGKLVV